MGQHTQRVDCLILEPYSSVRQNRLEHSEYLGIKHMEPQIHKKTGGSGYRNSLSASICLPRVALIISYGLFSSNSDSVSLGLLSD